MTLFLILLVALLVLLLGTVFRRKEFPRNPTEPETMHTKAQSHMQQQGDPDVDANDL